MDYSQFWIREDRGGSTEKLGNTIVVLSAEEVMYYFTSQGINAEAGYSLVKKLIQAESEAQFARKYSSSDLQLIQLREATVKTILSNLSQEMNFDGQALLNAKSQV